MEKVNSYEHYAAVLAKYKEGKALCSTNDMLKKDTVVALTTAGKLYFAEIDNTLWFFTNEGYFYTGVFYVPAEAVIQVQQQDKDVKVILTGRQDRYNVQWERELVTAGFEKYDNYLEYASQLEEIIENIQKQNAAMHKFWERRGFVYRRANRKDFDEMWKLWENKLGKNRYNITYLTDAEMEDMERYGRCIIICDAKGTIYATSMYERKNSVAYGTRAAALYQGSGLGACAHYELIESAYREGCTKLVSWARGDNAEGTNLELHTQQKPTGKYLQQFILKEAKNKA